LINKENKIGTTFVIVLLNKMYQKIKLPNKVIVMLNSFVLNNKMPKIVSAVAALSILSSTSLYAHDDCDIELDAGLTLNETTLEFFNDTQAVNSNKKVLYKIYNDHTLIVRGQEVDLNNQQQALVTQYSTSIRAMVPRVKTIAIEGVDLALEGVNLAFNELLGKGNNVGAELTQELSTLRDEVTTRFTAEHGITIDENGEEILGEEFEQRIESAVEKAVMNSMGSLLIAMGQKMLLSDDETGEDGNTFESQMESFGERMANEMETRAEKIGQKADALCSAVVDIDRLEEQLKASIPAMKNINVISATFNGKAGDRRLM
jgi:hypothetical protein